MTSIRKGARRKESLKWNLKFNAVGVFLRRTLSRDGEVIILFVDSKTSKFQKEKVMIHCFGEAWVVEVVVNHEKKDFSIFFKLQANKIK